MTKRVTSQTRAGSPYQASAFLHCATAFFAVSLLVGCSSSDTVTFKDSSADQGKDTVTTPIDATSDSATDSANKDLAIDAGGCTENGQFYTVGATVTRNGDCASSNCKCLSNGTVGQCTTSCVDASGPDTRRVDVAP